MLLFTKIHKFKESSSIIDESEYDTIRVCGVWSFYSSLRLAHLRRQIAHAGHQLVDAMLDRHKLFADVLDAADQLARYVHNLSAVQAVLQLEEGHLLDQRLFQQVANLLEVVGCHQVRTEGVLAMEPVDLVRHHPQAIVGVGDRHLGILVVDREFVGERQGGRSAEHGERRDGRY